MKKRNKKEVLNLMPLFPWRKVNGKIKRFTTIQANALYDLLEKDLDSRKNK